MKIRITRARQGNVDGVSLDTFAVGLTYDVTTELATYLVTTASAEPLYDGGEAGNEREARHAVNVQHWRDVAADLERPRDWQRHYSLSR